MNRGLLNIIVTEIREQLNDLIKIKTEYGTIRCCSASEHLLNRPDSTQVYLAFTAAELEQFRLCKLLHYVLKCVLHEIRAVVLSEDKTQDKGKRIIVVNCYYYHFIFAVRLSYRMYQ